VYYIYVNILSILYYVSVVQILRSNWIKYFSKTNRPLTEQLLPWHLEISTHEYDICWLLASLYMSSPVCVERLLRTVTYTCALDRPYAVYKMATP
jgi:hypothetical protein